MSGVSALRYIAANNSALIAVVPAARIFLGAAPLNTALPAISFRSISGVPENTVAMTESGRLQTERVQATVLAASYASLVTVVRLLRAALPNQSGTVNSVKVDSIIPMGDGPDLFDDGAAIYEASRDLMVRWHLP